MLWPMPLNMLDAEDLWAAFPYRDLNGLFERRCRGGAPAASADQLNVGDARFDFDEPNVTTVALDEGSYGVEGGVHTLEKGGALNHDCGFFRVGRRVSRKLYPPV